MNITRKQIVLLLSAFCVFSTLSASAQWYFEISGELELISYKWPNADGTPKRRTCSFSCIVGSNEWRITNDFMANGKEVHYFDGTNVYHSTMQTRDAPSGPVPAIPYEQVKSNMTVQIVPSPGGHPLATLGVNIPWLAFCSGNYLRMPGRVLPSPTMNVREELSAWGYVDRASVFKDELGLPQKLELLTSREAYERSFTEERVLREPFAIQRKRINRRPLTFAEGIVMFEYEVTATTNTLFGTVPLSFAYTDYFLDPAGKRQRRVGGLAKVKVIRESTKPENVFAAEMHQTEIWDYRFRHKKMIIDGIAYRRTNLASAPPVESPELVAQYQQTILHPPPVLKEPARIKRRSLQVIILAAALLGFPLIIYFGHKRKQKTKVRQ
jgi:hypothetical protein